jgi:hypothetical protein
MCTKSHVRMHSDSADTNFIRIFQLKRERERRGGERDRTMARKKERDQRQRTMERERKIEIYRGRVVRRSHREMR